ncbi:palmdelphin [Embiotoca jacksoni]|uniref:palmdelphin n=1 Tax=Embiotoca jacksoni TaxID=100190 RepID=UPI0037039FEE
MEECDLVKERLQAITEKHRIQEDIRQKKLELDHEKLKLQHLKKKALREQWLLQDSTSHNATDSMQQNSYLCDQQQTRALQLSIHRIEMEVESLDRRESRISTHESFILKRLKAVEKSPQDVIKEAQGSFVPAMFALEINVTKDMLTGESAVLSAAVVPPEDVNQHAGLKVYDDGRKCVYALDSQKWSHDQSSVSELSAKEVEDMLRSATVHRQAKHRNYAQTLGGREERCFYEQRDDERHRAEGRGLRDGAEGCALRDGAEGCGPRDQGGRYGCHLPRSSSAQTDLSHRDNWQQTLHDERRRRPLDSRQEDRNSGSHCLGNHKELGARNCHSVRERGPAYHHTDRPIRGGASEREVPNGYARPTSHDPEVATAHQPPLCYTPASHIPLCDYISVDEEELFCYRPPSYHSYSHDKPSAPYRDPAHCYIAPPPLCGDDAPYTILTTLDTTEPITAVFMGYQMAHDDSGELQEFEGSLKAELVIIEDDEGNCGDGGGVREKSHGKFPTGSYANGKTGAEDRLTERRLGPGIRKIQKKHKACCSVC